MNIVDRKIVLSLNGNWQAIGLKTVKNTFISMMGGNSDNPPVQALDIQYPMREDGSYDFNQMPLFIPCSWVEWQALPIREYDLVVNTTRNKIRVPTVVVAVNYKHIPKKRQRPTLAVLLEMQKGICGLTGEKITLKEANLEHKIPRSHGGKDTFENLMAVGKKINSIRGNKPYEDLGLKPRFHHKQPAPIPVNFTIKNRLSNDWKWFMGDS